MPADSGRRIKRALAARWQETTPPVSTPEHRAYAAKVAAPEGATTCTLDRNCRGVAVLEERAYHAAMEDVFGDAKYYKILVTEKEKKEALAKLHEHEVRWRPARLATKQSSPRPTESSFLPIATAMTGLTRRRCCSWVKF